MNHEINNLEPTLYDTHMKENFDLFGIPAFLYACFYTLCMYKNDAGISYFFLVLASIGLNIFFVKKLELRLKNGSGFYMVSMVLLSIATFCTDDRRIIFFNKIGVFLLTVSMLLDIIYQTKGWNLGKYLLSIIQTCGMAIGEMGKPFTDGIWFCKNKLDKKNSKYLYLLIGVGITIPLFLIVFALLTSADAVFRNAANQLFSGSMVGDVFAVVLLTAFVFLTVYCVMTYLCKQEIKETVEDSRKWEALIAIPVATVLSAMYLVFSGIQIVYLFMGNMQLPEGYTYAAYAREGFFQLLAVSILNLVLVLVGLYYFKSSKVLKAVLSIMSLCTFIMIASSAMRMVIYIQYYYLTFLRILVLWSLLVLFVIFVGVMIYIIKEDFPLFRYSMIVFTCFYIGLSFSHPDYWIARINIASMYESSNDFFKGAEYDDYKYLANLSADAAPMILDWMVAEYLYGTSDVNKKISDKEVCIYTYSCIQVDGCKDVGLWNFNTSRFYVKQRTK